MCLFSAVYSLAAGPFLRDFSFSCSFSRCLSISLDNCILESERIDKTMDEQQWLSHRADSVVVGWLGIHCGLCDLHCLVVSRKQNSPHGVIVIFRGPWTNHCVSPAPSVRALMMLWFVWLQENVESSGGCLRVCVRLPDGDLGPFLKWIKLLLTFALLQ